MSEDLELKIYSHSITTREIRKLYDAVEAAASQGETTYVTIYGKRAAIVPEAIAKAAESPAGNPGCSACRDGRHEECARHFDLTASDPQPCDCDQRAMHAQIMADQVAAARNAVAVPRVSRRSM